MQVDSGLGPGDGWYSTAAKPGRSRPATTGHQLGLASPSSVTGYSDAPSTLVCACAFCCGACTAAFSPASTTFYRGRDWKCPATLLRATDHGCPLMADANCRLLPPPHLLIHISGCCFHSPTWHTPLTTRRSQRQPHWTNGTRITTIRWVDYPSLSKAMESQLN